MQSTARVQVVERNDDGFSAGALLTPTTTRRDDGRESDRVGERERQTDATAAANGTNTHLRGSTQVDI